MALFWRSLNRERRSENKFLQDASRQEEAGRTRTDFMMKEVEEERP